MSQAEIPPQVLKFLAEKIGTVMELEALLIMRNDAQRAWTDQDMASRLYTQPAAAARALASLASRELITAEGKPPKFRFRPAHSDDRKLIAEVADAHRQNLVAITARIHSNASASAQKFAPALEQKTDR